jgi:hypothetical protein
LIESLMAHTRSLLSFLASRNGLKGLATGAAPPYSRLSDNMVAKSERWLRLDI